MGGIGWLGVDPEFEGGLQAPAAAAIAAAAATAAAAGGAG